MVAGLGEGGGVVVLWLWLMVVLEKIKEVVVIWRSFRVSGVLNGDERERR